MKHNQRCTCCINDKTVKHIVFDKKGVCNFCNTYFRYEKKLHDYAYLETLFLKKVKEPHSHLYDVALGISGGKDSAYVLYKLVKKYHLKVCTYTLDNGFLTTEAKEKIDNLVKEFDVPHEYVVCDKVLLKSMYHSITKRYLSPCIACSFLGYACMINYASKVDAHVGMHGRSIPQMLRNFSDDVEDYFKPLLLDGLKEEGTSPEQLFETLLQKITTLVDKTLASKIKKELLKDAYQKGFRPFIAYFLYHPYHKEKLIAELQLFTSWKVEAEEEHFDCLIHHGALHLKNITARRHHCMPEFSVMIREQTISRADAIKLLESKEDKTQAKKELKLFCKYAGLNYTLLLLKAKLYGKRWW
jgi:Predicted ATPase of the PP-loop superfamily implicated in cell cycle control